MKEPKFVPKPGQVDYSKIRYAPVINSVILKDGKILLVRRSDSLRLYPGYWNGISGFLDTNDEIEDKVYEELSEEAGIDRNAVLSITVGQVLVQEAPEYKKTWIVFPVLAKISSSDVKINWENADAKWFSPKEISKLKLVPGFDQVLSQFIDLK